MQDKNLNFAAAIVAKFLMLEYCNIFSKVNIKKAFVRYNEMKFFFKQEFLISISD